MVKTLLVEQISHQEGQRAYRPLHCLTVDDGDIVRVVLRAADGTETHIADLPHPGVFGNSYGEVPSVGNLKLSLGN